MEAKGSEQNGSRNFHQSYKVCCKSENITPLKALAAKNNGQMLDFCVDRIKYADWAPILISLSDDLSLNCLAIRCRSQVKTVIEQADSERVAKNVTRTPVILTKFMLCNLVDAIAQCLSQNKNISMLQMEGLPLYSPYVDPISESLSLNNSLKHISFHGCLIGDVGCQKVCVALRSAHNVVTLNLSACNLTAQAGEHISQLIKFLKIYRYSENWKQTLRYQNPDLDSMPGLRRITLSDNPEFCDGGLMHLIEVLLDDLWIKAIDLQQCGLTEAIVKNCLQLLEFNSTLRVLDIRYNNSISMKSVGSIALALRKNENSTTFDQTWLTVSSTSIIHKDQKIPPKSKSSNKKEKPPLQGNLGNSFVMKNNENRSMNELLHLNILKDQLKQEIAHRRQLEELNEKLLQQVKELKQQQIAQWKYNNYLDMAEANGMQLVKPKQPYTINLNENVCHTHSEKKHVTNCCKHNKIGNIPVADNSNNCNSDIFKLNDLTSQDLKRRICTGADILEQLLEHRFNSRNDGKAEYEDIGSSNVSSDSSSAENTVRHVKKSGAHNDSGDEFS